MRTRSLFCIARSTRLSFSLGCLLSGSAATAQGPAPETAPPLFPSGGLISYNSIFTSRNSMPGISSAIPPTAFPSFSHQADFNFTWGFYRNFDFTVRVPIVTNHFNLGRVPAVGGTGVGDTMLLVKYRFYRRDSPRGTTQASVTFGPKLPTGRTNLNSATGNRLPTGLQPGTGSTDVFLAASWTYTGLFNIRRLVADENFQSLRRSQGSRATRLGSDFDSRFWLSYRPYESSDGAREWFVGPTLTWQHSQDDRIAGITQSGSGGNSLLAGVTTFVGLRPGTHVWLGMDWNVAHSRGAIYMPVRRRISLGVTQQFRMHRFW